MKLQTTFHGNDVLFEGDLPLALRAIPAGAHVTRATLTLAPVSNKATDPVSFEESLQGAAGARFGLDIRPTSTEVVIGLGARRTIASVAGLQKTAGNIGVQLDMGGLWLAIDGNGSPLIPAPATGPFATDTSTGKLEVPGPPIGPAPPLTTQGLRLSGFTTQTPADDVIVTVASAPSNLTLRIGNLGPFWFRLGDLRAETITPDFTEFLQAFTERNQPVDGVFEIPFILHSDTLGRLRLTLDVEYHLEQSLLAPELKQLALPFDYNAVPTAQPVALQARLPLNAQVLPGRTSAEVVGRFDESRVVYGSIGAVRGGETVKVTPQQSLAQPIRLARAQAATAIDLHVEALTATATLLVTMQEDVGGKPYGPSLLAEPIQMPLARPAAGGALWASAALPDGFTFRADRTYWLIVNSSEGDVNVALEPSPAGQPGVQYTRTAGLAWRELETQLAAPASVLYRLRGRPAAFRQPISLDVAGRRVSLAAYDALGKVGFRVDLPEVAQAVNAALADAAQQQAPLAERIVNGDFARWTRVEHKACRLAADPLALEASAAAMLAAAPDATQVYCLADTNSQPQEPLAALVITNDPQPRLAAEINLPTGQTAAPGPTPHSLVISPSGDSLYAIATSYSSWWLWRVDMSEAGASIAQTLQIITSASGYDSGRPCLAVAPDCASLYLAGQDLAGQENGSRPAVLLRYSAKDLTKKPDRLEIGAGEQTLEPLGLFVSPDGQRAYWATTIGGWIIDLEAWRSIGWVSYGSSNTPWLAAVALSPDGTRLYAVVRWEEPVNDRWIRLYRLFTLDTELLEQVAAGWAIAAEAKQSKGFQLASAVVTMLHLKEFEGEGFPTPVTMVATPDGTRLLIGIPRDYSENPEPDRLYVVDTIANRLVETLALPAAPVVLSVTPDSCRAFVLTQQYYEGDETSHYYLRAIELDGWTADGWALTGGRVAPVCVPGATKPSARLGHPSASTGLAQVFTVTGGQTYELRFSARALGENAGADLFWLSKTCGLVGQWTQEIDAEPCRIGLKPFLARMTAPTEADRAELRFRKPATGYLVIDDVSFQAASQATANGDFGIKAPANDPTTNQPIKDAKGNLVYLPEGWHVAAGNTPLDQVIAFDPDGVLQLTASLPHPAELSQALTVTAGKPFTVEFQAYPVEALAAQGAARLELRWTGSKTAALTYEIGQQRFDVTRLDGVVPADATGAVLAFVQPPVGHLAVVAVGLSQIEPVEVPLTFLSEAPGELTVIAPQVAYDLGDEPRPTPPQITPPPPVDCKPTPPDDVPAPEGAAGPGEGQFLAEPAMGYCPCCETVHFLENPETTFSEGGMSGIGGTCPRCEAKVITYATNPGAKLTAF